MLSDMLRPEQRQTLMAYLEEQRRKQQGQTPQTMNTPTDLPAQPLPQPPAPVQPPQTAQDVVGPDFNDDARKKMLDDANRTKPGQVVGDAMAGFGDALARSYGGDAGAHHLQGALDQQNLDQKRKVEQFNQGREQKTQNYTLGQQIIKNNRENQNTQELMDPVSNVSKANMVILKQLGYTGPELPALHAEVMVKDYLEKHKADVDAGYKNWSMGREVKNDAIKQVESAQKGLEGDEEYKGAIKTKDAVNELRTMASQAATNPAAANAVSIALARLSTGGQRISQIEVERLGGSKAMTDRFQQAVKNAAKGTLTDDNIRFIQQYADIYEKSSHDALAKSRMRHAQNLSAINKKPVEENYRDITGGETMPTDQAAADAGGQPAQVMTATNKKTGERIQSSDGGKTWQPAK